jgi:catechol 2,3-dioxygenase-like lactoylglutathione lyase family enzyme
MTTLPANPVASCPKVAGRTVSSGPRGCPDRLVACLLLLACGTSFAADLPIKGISHVGFRIADLEKTRAFYTGILGFQQAFDQKDASGKTTLAVFKINDDQFLEFSPGTPPGFTHIAFLTDKLETLRQSVEHLGLNPPELRTGHDRTRNFSIKDPDGHRVEFVQYEPDSMQAQSLNRFPNGRLISARLSQVGLPVADRAAALTFFRDTLGVMSYIELLHQGAALTLYVEVLKPKQTAHLKDPDGTPIELLSAAR